MFAKGYKMEAVNPKSNEDTNRFVSMLDSEEFDNFIEKVLQSMFSVIFFVGIPYLLYIVTKALF